MALHKCPHCGKMISDKAEKCPRCNHPVGQDTLPVNNWQTAVQNTHAPNNDRKNDNRNPDYNTRVIVYSIIIATIVIVGVILFVSFYPKQDSKETAVLDSSHIETVTPTVELPKDTVPTKEDKREHRVKEKQKPVKKKYKPLTQWYLVNAEGYMPSLRNPYELARKLEHLGFKVNSIIYNRLTAYRDDMSVDLRYSDEIDESDCYCIINFGSYEELDDFIESMHKSHWTKSGKYYFHKDNDGGNGVAAKIEGLNVTLVEMWEGLPGGF